MNPLSYVKVILGHKTQAEIQQFYSSQPIHLFLHVSRTEGLGMAIIEAQSYGIPQMCCAAGGVVDVVTEKTGVLLPVIIEPTELACEIEKFIKSDWNREDIRPSIQKAFTEKFEIGKNFIEMNKLLNS